MTRSEAAQRRDADFEQIEAAVMETARGRWFLAEFVRRNRNADTVAILNGLSKLEAVVRRAAPARQAPPKQVPAKQPPAPPPPARSRPTEDVTAMRREVHTALGHVRDAETRLRASIAGLDPMSTERVQLRVVLSLYEAASTKLSAVLGELPPPKAKPAELPAASAEWRPLAPRSKQDVFFEPSVLLSRLSGLATVTAEPTPPPQVTAPVALPAPAPLLTPIPAAVSAQLDAVLARLIQPEARPADETPVASIEPPAEPVAARAPEGKAETPLKAPLETGETSDAEPAAETMSPVSSRSTAALRVAAAVQLDRAALGRPVENMRPAFPRAESDARPVSEAASIPARPAVALRTAATLRIDRSVTEAPIADDPTASMSRAEKIALFS